MKAEICAIKSILQSVQRELTKRQAREREGILLTRMEGWSDHTAGLIALRDLLQEQIGEQMQEQIGELSWN